MNAAESKRNAAPLSENATFKISDVRPCADNEGMMYLEGQFENITLARLCEVLKERSWDTLIMQATGGVVGRLDGMLLVLTGNLTFHFSNSPTEEDALKELVELVN